LFYLNGNKKTLFAIEGIEMSNLRSELEQAADYFILRSTEIKKYKPEHFRLQLENELSKDKKFRLDEFNLYMTDADKRTIEVMKTNSSNSFYNREFYKKLAEIAKRHAVFVEPRDIETICSPFYGFYKNHPPNRFFQCLTINIDCGYLLRFETGKEIEKRHQWLTVPGKEDFIIVKRGNERAYKILDDILKEI
jgi:hypothetical protein